MMKNEKAPSVPLSLRGAMRRGNLSGARHMTEKALRFAVLFVI